MYKKIILAVVIMLIVIVLCIVVCCSYRPIWKSELPAECNMTLNMYKMYYDVKDKSAIIPPTDICYKKLQRLSCQAEIFGINNDGNPNPVNYDDPKLYRNYTQCLSELK